MAPWREISAYSADQEACRKLARRVFDVYGTALSEWETTFLESIARNSRADKFSTRQAEKLLQIRDDLMPVDVLLGFNLSTVLQRCFEARLDLTDDEEPWLVELHNKGDKYFRMRDGRRLLGCAKRLGLIEAAR
jgi:hypothetical protein